MPEIPLAQLDSRLQRMVENARLAVERQNLDYALELCSTVLAQQPGCLPVRRLLRLAQTRRFKARNRLLAKALGGVASAGPLMAASAALRKDPAKALEGAERALNNDPTNVAALKLLAQAAAALDLPETAAFAWESVRELQPGSRDVALAFGEALVAAGRHGEAVKVADELLARDRMDPEAQGLLKHASVAHSIDRGNWDSATGSYRDKLKDEARAVSLEQASKVVASEEATRQLLAEARARLEREPANLNHHRAVIDYLRQLGDFAGAVAAVRAARQTPTGAADGGLARLEADLEARRLEAEIAACGDDPARADRRAALQRDLASLRLEATRSQVERYPNDLEARQAYGALLLELGRHDEAIAQFQQSQRSPKVRLAALTGLGACFQAKGLHDLALNQYETAKLELPAMDEAKKNIVYHLAQCLERMGQTERAIAEYKLIYATDIGYRDVAAKIDAYYAGRRGG